eukprot:TRINITY_DN54363_c0_g1_i1.p1 TRINITY_DN54363_c0_g1~~TRINITY_DN54363_c0_g1_i1.p1  ORF type:complete len:393 (-),score=65.79 TRINITY_DN54363_c0_g1_i1:63-1175(-)
MDAEFPLWGRCLLGLGATAVVAKWFLTRRIAHIKTGAQRRSLHPIGEPIGPGARKALASKDVCIKREMHTLKDGSQIFCQSMKSSSTAPTHVLVFLHGYTSQTDIYLEAFTYFARKGALVLMPDLPCHGRSDGLLTYVPDWFAWVAQIWEFLELVVPPARGAGGGKPLPAFACGISLGGGLASCLAVQRPSFFDGVALIAPMLVVSDHLKPPRIVQEIFKRLALLLPTWPLTPSKSLDEFDFRVPEQGRQYVKCNPMSMQGLKSRLGTTKAFAFDFVDWIGENFKEFRTPFLVLHGTADKITDPEGSKRLHEEAPVKDKSIKLFDGGYHCELFCCLPGNAELIGMEWLPEQTALTQNCFDEIAAWVAKRI